MQKDELNNINIENVLTNEACDEQENANVENVQEQNSTEITQEAQSEQSENAEQTEQSENGNDEKVEYVYKEMSPLRMVGRRFFRSKLSIVGLVMIVFLVLFSFLGPVIYDKWGEETVDRTEVIVIVRTRTSISTRTVRRWSLKRCFNTLPTSIPTQIRARITFSARTTKGWTFSCVLCTADVSRSR